MRLTDRSRIIQFARCPRSRYWEYEYQGTGIRRARLNLPLLVGRAVHTGLARLLTGCNSDIAVIAGQAEFDAQVLTSGIELEQTEQAEYVHTEQRALVEGLVRLVAIAIVPKLLTQYLPLSVEEELQATLPRCGIPLMGRSDALLKEQETGDLYLLSWKTKASWDDRAGEDAQHDDQGLSETWLTEMTKSVTLAGVIMCWVFKGERREYPKGSGTWTQSSPLIRGYRKFGADGVPEYAWKYQWEDLDGTSHRLGKGWQRFDAWAEPGGVKWWVDLLATGTVQPEAGPCLESQYRMPAPFYRRPEHIQDWVTQASVQEGGIADDLVVEVDWNVAFPQHRHSCSYPLRCAFYNLCWGPSHIAADPLENGYVRRVPHHALEAAQWEAMSEVSDGE